MFERSNMHESAKQALSNLLWRQLNVSEGLHHVVEGARAVTLGFSFEKHQHGRSPKPRPVPVDGGGGHGGKVGQRRTLINCPEERDRNCDAAASLG